MNSTSCISYKHDPAIHNFFATEKVLPFLLGLKQINSILDVGCGTGTWLAVARKLGIVNFLGIDGINLTADELEIPIDNFINYDTSSIRLNKKFDLLLSLEVAEHLPEQYAETFIKTLTIHSDFIVFSAAVPNQGGQNHLNEQWPKYWQNIFSKFGYYPSDTLRNYFWNNEDIEWWYKQNMIVYAPKNIFTSLNLIVADEVKSLIHPDLFQEKLHIMEELQNVIQKELWAPSIKNAFKRFIKSVIK